MNYPRGNDSRGIFRIAVILGGMLKNSADFPAQLDDAWQRLELLVDELATWSQQADSLVEYYGRLVERSVAELAVVGGAVWIPSPGRPPQRLGPVQARGAADVAVNDAQRAFVAETFQQESVADAAAARWFRWPGTDQSKRPAENRGSAGPPAAAVDDPAICLAPVVVDDRVVAILEFVIESTADVAQRAATERVATALADVSTDFHRVIELRVLRRRAAHWDAALEFALEVHRRLGLDETCYTIANRGRHFVGVDRLSVVVARAAGGRVRAISGVDSIDRRAQEVTLFRQLASAAIQLGEPLRTQDGDELPPQLQAIINRYHDTTGAHCLAVVPLADPSAPHDARGGSRAVGALIFEQFKGSQFPAAVLERMDICCGQAGTALANAVLLHGAPLSGVARGLRRFAWLLGFRSLGRFAGAALAGLLLVAAVVASLCLVQVDFAITARGRLQPTERRQVFAPMDGVVSRTFVQHGDHVQRGQILIELRNLDLEYEAKRLRGELATTRAELEAVQAARMIDGRDRRQAILHDAEIERHKERLVGLEKQREILQRQQQELAVCAMINGQVLSWDTEKALAARPVRRGQQLMTIGNVAGPWQVQLDVPDEEIGHLLSAQRASGDDGLPVEFILQTDPAKAYRGTVASVGMATVVTGDSDPSIPVVVNVDRAALSAPRPGAGVVARLHCGRRAVGFVWFRRLWEEVRRRAMF